MMLSACSDNDSLDVPLPTVCSFFQLPSDFMESHASLVRVEHGNGRNVRRGGGGAVGIGFAFTFNGYVRLPENELIT